MKGVSWYAAFIFICHLSLAGIWDIYVIYFNKDLLTISQEIRSTWLRYPMGVIIAAFLFIHFWKRG